MLCVTLFREDMQDLMHIFFAQCQSVEVFIDGHAIVADAQLEAFPPGYRASSLLMRGSYVQGTEPRLIQLRMRRMHTKLSGQRWNDSVQKVPPILQDIRTVLKRNSRNGQNTVLSLTLQSMFFIFPQTFLANSMNLGIADTPIAYIFLIALALAMGLFCLFSLHGLLHLLGINRYIYLLPGTMRTAASYGRKEIGATLIVAGSYACLLYVLTLVAARWFSMLMH